MNLNVEDFLKSDEYKYQISKLLDFLENKRIVLYGVLPLKTILSNLNISTLNIVGVSDGTFKNEEYGKKCLGFPILPINKIIEEDPDIILLTSFDRLIPFVELRHVLSNSHAQLFSIFSEISKPNLNYLELHVVDHCNLNCKSCAVYSPISPQKFHCVKLFESDFNELSKKIDVACIRLMGGEPLLHPEIEKFLTISRKKFLLSDIHLVTNGILLPNMNESFWRVCRDNSIKIDVSIYPPMKDKKFQYIELIKQKNVKVGFINNVNCFFHARFNKNYNEDILKTYKECWQNNCVNLREGHLVTCAMACYLDYFNDYFHKKLPIDKGINIYDNSGQEIVNYLNTPVKLCSYCALDKRNLYQEPWDYSKKEVQEWLESD